jgi:hypothetical protein
VLPTPLTYVAPPPAVPEPWGPYCAPTAPPGLFFDLDLWFVKPTLHNNLGTSSPLPLPGLTVPFGVPRANLGWTVTPTFELGYRLPDDLGFFALSYRFEEADGRTTATLDGIPTPFGVRTRADLNTLALDYGNGPHEFAPCWDFSWRLGVQVTDFFLDTRASDPAFSEHESSNFWGAGPHARFEVARRLGFLPGLSAFARLDGQVLIGRTTQRVGINAGGTSLFSDSFHRTGTIPVLQVQTGLTYTPPVFRNFHLSAGFVYERYWDLGLLGLNPDFMSFPGSHAGLDNLGAFLRAQVDF